MQRLGLVGTGMIGGSFALALREAGEVREVIGYDASTKAVREAITLGVVDKRAASIGELTRVCDAILVAVPVNETASCVQACLDAGAEFVMEAGSVKRQVFEALGERVKTRFASVHPIAGSDKSGPSAARADMYQDRVLVVISEGEQRLRQQASALWSACGSQVIEMDAQSHDATLALTSHLPHLLAFSLMRLVSEGEPHSLKPLMGPGFRDFTRLARADDRMWQAIFEANRDVLDAEITRYQAELEAMRKRINDTDAMRAALREATATFAVLQ